MFHQNKKKITPFFELLRGHSGREGQPVGAAAAGPLVGGRGRPGCLLWRAGVGAGGRHQLQALQGQWAQGGSGGQRPIERGQWRCGIGIGIGIGVHDQSELREFDRGDGEEGQLRGLYTLDIVCAEVVIIIVIQ